MAKARFDLNTIHIVVGLLALIGLGFASWVLLNVFGAMGTIGAVAGQVIWASVAIFAFVLCCQRGLAANGDQRGILSDGI